MAKKRMINGKMPVNEVRQVGEGARGALPPALRATSPDAEEVAGDAWNVQDEQSGPVGVDGPIGVEQVREAARVLHEYMAGKKALNEKIINNEQWYRLHNQGGAEKMTLSNAPDSAWLFNSLANKHADAMDNYPEPNVLPRAKDDTDTAKQLSADPAGDFGAEPIRAGVQRCLVVQDQARHRLQDGGVGRQQGGGPGGY